MHKQVMDQRGNSPLDTCKNTKSPHTNILNTFENVKQGRDCVNNLYAYHNT
jgi:hypothetical protein